MTNSFSKREKSLKRFLLRTKSKLKSICEFISLLMFKRFLDKLLIDKQKLSEENRNLKNQIINLNDENDKYSNINKKLSKEISFLIDRVRINFILIVHFI